MKYQLSEILDLDELKSICESFTAIYGTVTAILDLDGNILVATGWQHICTQFHRRNPETALKCTESDTTLAKQLKLGSKYNVYKCKNGLYDIAVPIIIENEHIGNFFSGQFFTEEPDIDFFKKQAKKYGFNEEKYIEALLLTPIFTEEQVKKSANFLVLLTETIGKIGLRNIKNIEQSAQLFADQIELKKLNEEYALLNAEYKSQNDELHLKYSEILAAEEELRASNEELLATSDALKNSLDELQEAKAILERNEKLLNETGEIAMVGGWEINLKTNKLTWTKEVYRIHEVDENFLPTVERAISFYDEPSLPIISNCVNEAVLTGKPFNTELGIITAKGKHKIVNAKGKIKKDTQGNIEFVYGTFQDITEQKKLLNDLHETKNKIEASEKAYRDVVETTNDLITIVDKEGKFIFLNHSAKIFFDMESADCIGKSAFEFIHPDDKEYTLNKFNDWIKSGNSDFQFENRQISVKGKITYTAWNIHLDKENSEIVKITSIARDITELKKAEIKLKEKNEEYSSLNEELKQTNEELFYAKEIAEENHKKFRQTFEHAGIGMVLVSPEGKLLELNKSACDILGYNENEMLNMNFQDFTHPDDLEKDLNLLYQTLEGKINHYSIAKRYFKKNGEIVWTNLNVTLVRDSNKEPLYFISQIEDITKQVNSEQELKRQLELFSTLLENLTQGVFMVEVPSGKPLLANEAAKRILGRGILPDANKQNLSEVYEAYKAGTNVPYPIEEMPIVLGMSGIKAYIDDMIVMRPDSTQTYLEIYGTPVTDSNGKIYASLVSFSDITERKKIEQALQRTQHSIDNITDSIFWIDEHANLIFTNKPACKNLDYSIDELLKLKVFDIDPVFPKEKWTEHWQELITKNSFSIETIHKTKNGVQYPVEVSVNKVEFDGIIYNCAIAKNITERKKSQLHLQEKNEEYASLNEELNQVNEELHRAKEKAEESDRLKTAFLQNMSHEIRTPLNAISGFAGMLNKPDITTEKRKNFVSIIQNSSLQLVNIVSDILTISSLETNQEKTNISKVCINDTIVELLAIFKQQAMNQNISLYAKQQLTDSQSEIYTDKTKVVQILSNLISNALKFTHKGYIEFGYTLKQENLPASIEFYVKDSGIGISKELHYKIFERFRQADKTIQANYGGTGLGLSISKGFAELLGGEIWVQSEPEKGSTFYFTVPYKPVNKETDNNSIIQKYNNQPVILVAEDEEFNYLFIEEILNDMNFKLIHAKNGQETIDICTSDTNIDLILMDIKMPVIDGYQAAIVIKDFLPDVPIIAQSAYALEHERAKFESIFDDYITKPINESELKQKILKYINTQK